MWATGAHPSEASSCCCSCLPPPEQSIGSHHLHIIPWVIPNTMQDPVKLIANIWMKVFSAELAACLLPKLLSKLAQCQLPAVRDSGCRCQGRRFSQRSLRLQSERQSVCLCCRFQNVAIAYQSPVFASGTAACSTWAYFLVRVLRQGSASRFA